MIFTKNKNLFLQNIKRLKKSNIVILGTSPRANQIRVFLYEYLDISIPCFIDENPNNCEKQFYDVLAHEPKSYLEANPDSVVIIGTIIPEYQNNLIRMLESYPFNGTIIRNEEFHQEYEIPLICSKASKNYKIDFETKMNKWMNNFLSEVQFWDYDVSRMNSPYWQHYLDRTAVKEFYCERAMNLINKDSIVLDVGCGVCTQYGDMYQGSKLNIKGVDPLASFYNKINERYCKQYNVEQKVPKVDFGMFELLSYQYGNNYADVILIDNALDHCIDPLMAINECLKTLKVGGTLSTLHHIDEAYKAFYSDLHQWNICLDNNNFFLLWNHENYINVNEIYKNYVNFDSYVVKSYKDETPYGVVISNMRKIKDIPENFLDQENKKRIGIILENMMNNLSSNEYALKLLSLNTKI